MILPATPNKASTRHIRVDRPRAVGPAPGISPVVPVDREDHRRRSGTRRREDSLRGVMVDPDVLDRIAGRLRVS